MVLCTAWLIPAVFIILVDCELNTPWRAQGGQCLNLVSSTSTNFFGHVLIEFIVPTMAVHSLCGRHNRAHNFRSRRRSAEGSFHEFETQTRYWICLYFPFPVSYLSDDRNLIQ